MPTPIKIPAMVEEATLHAEGVKSLVLRPLKKCPAFRPGQFLHLAIDPYDPSFNWPESRVFSIASSPTRRDRLRVVFSVKGTFTKRMYDEIEPGKQLFVKLPYGRFTFPEDGRGIVLIAGGTGITPFISFLEYAIDKGISRKISLFYGFRDPAHFLFGSFLRECRKTLPGFELSCFVESGETASVDNNAEKGIIPVKGVLEKTGGTDEEIFFLAGPPGMITAFRDGLSQSGLPTDRIVTDDWE